VLPASSRALVRNPDLYYVIKEYVGLTFHYDYHLTYTAPAFENAFFGYLNSIAVAHPLTEYQTRYNHQSARSLTVTTNYWINAPSVARWLADHAGPLLGLDTSHYTIFLINWYGRPDFKFHVYTKTDEPEPDTGYNKDNTVNGEQQFVYAFDSPGARADGYGFTVTTIHEVGHYLGLSHPLDGYDYEADLNFDATGPFYFVSSANETNSVMSYIDLNWDFGQFDRDNMNRYLTAVYINYANRVADLCQTTRGGYRCLADRRRRPGCTGAGRL
jgi:hypothetical protein